MERENGDSFVQFNVCQNALVPLIGKKKNDLELKHITFGFEQYGRGNINSLVLKVEK